MNKIYTIGHSTHLVDKFYELLKRSGINVVVDVRSVPFSQFADQYNKDNLMLFLQRNNILYIHMGNLLGARYDDSSLLFSDGKVDFEKVVKTKEFIEGINRINEGLSKGYNIALMCSERNPLECHRFSMISYFLDSHGYDVQHILPEKVISHKLLEDKLFNFFKGSQKISLELDKILNMTATQKSLFFNPSKSDLYLCLNKMVAFNPYAVKGE